MAPSRLAFPQSPQVAAAVVPGEAVGSVRSAYSAPAVAAYSATQSPSARHRLGRRGTKDSTWPARCL